MKDSSSKSSLGLVAARIRMPARIWPFVIVAAMIIYVVALLLLVVGDVTRTSELLGKL